MEKLTYEQQLTSPLWAMKRRSILDRDRNRCRRCKTSHAVLQVHHTVYITGCKPWDHPDDTLVTLCAKCHKEEEKFKIEIGDLVTDLSYLGYSYKEIFQHLEKLKNG